MSFTICTLAPNNQITNRILNCGINLWEIEISDEFINIATEINSRKDVEISNKTKS